MEVLTKEQAAEVFNDLVLVSKENYNKNTNSESFSDNSIDYCLDCFEGWLDAIGLCPYCDY